jgi:hypothetical protein
MVDRGTWMAGAGIFTFVGLMLWQGVESTITAVTGEEVQKEILNPTSALSSEFESGYKAYTRIPKKVVLYEVVPDPTNGGRECVRIGEYSDEAPHTLVGASTVVGPDSDIYVDIGGGTIHSSDGTIIGYFDRSKLPVWSDAPGVDPDSIVCANNE